MENKDNQNTATVENNKIEQIRIKPGEADQIFFNFVGGGIRVEVHGYSETLYSMKFTDENTDKIYKEFTDIKAGEFRMVDVEYYVKWNILVNDQTNNKEVRNYILDLKDKNVFISYESSALGDTVAWMPYVEEFRKKHNCKIVCASFHNELFKEIYPDIIFVERGQPIQGIHVAYKLGWFGSGHPSKQNPNDCHIIPLHKVASDILGLPYKEIRPRIKNDKGPKLFKKGKYIVITTCSTAQFKYYNYPHGWQEIVDWYVKRGYTVIAIGKQPVFLKNIINFTGKKEMSQIINLLQNADYFVGLPSGLAWLNWALNKKSVMITGISDAYCEYREDNYRVEPEDDKCSGCFNSTDPSEVFNKGLWLFCPRHQDDIERRFECTKSIKPQKIFNVCKLLEMDLKNKKPYFSMTNEECEEYLNNLDLEFKY